MKISSIFVICEHDFQFVAFNCPLMPKMGKHMDVFIIYCFEFFEF